MSDDPHAVAVLALLGTLPAGIGLYPDKVPNGTIPPYVKPYISVEYPEASDSRALDLASSRAVVTVTCHCVGATSSSARIVAGQVRTRLLDITPTVTGRQCFPIRQEQSVPAGPDETTGALVMDQIDFYRLESTPG